MTERPAYCEDRWGLFDGERKLVTVMFADIVDSSRLVADKDPEEANAILLSVLQIMIDSVHRFGGIVSQILGDGIMAIFGAPVAQEKHALRACLAADTMQMVVKRAFGGDSPLPHAGRAIRVGVNSGDVVTHIVESDTFPSYRAVGETVHLASRMESAARPGTIVIAGSTLKLVSDQVRARPITPVSLADGHIAEAFEVAKVTRDRNALRDLAGRRSAAFVGRQDDIVYLGDLLEGAKRSDGKAVVVTGDAGVGKSRLVLEFLESIVHGDCQVVECNLLPSGLASPREPLARVVRGLLMADQGPAADQTRAMVSARLNALDIRGEDALASVLAILGIESPSSFWLGLDPEGRFRITIDTVTQVILAASRRRPVIVVIEDFHWADSETRLLARELAMRLASSRVLLVITSRHSHEGNGATWPGMIEHPLGPLSKRQSSDLLRALMGSEPGLDDLKIALIKKTQGIPFFMEECVHALVESGALTGMPGRYRLAIPVTAVEIPPTVHGVLAARIDDLAPANRSLLLCASVIDQRFDVGLLQDLTGIPRHALMMQLDQLLGAGFIQRTRTMPNLEYSFRHALIHEVAYGTLLRRRRRDLHARLTTAIESRRTARLPDKIELLAHHAFRAEAWAKAFVYCRRAGQKAQSKSRNREAVECFEDALHALEKLPRTRRATERSIDTRLDLTQSLFPLGEHDHVDRQLLQAQALAEQTCEERRLSIIASNRSLYHWTMGDIPKAIDTGETALKIARKLNDAKLEILSAGRLGALLVDRGDYETACQLLGPVIHRIPNHAVHKRFGLLATASVASRATLALALGELGRFREAIRVGDEAIRIADDVGHAFSQIYALLWVSNALLRKGDFERSIPHLERGYALCESTRSKLLYPLAAGSLGYAYVRTGKVSWGLTLLENAVRSADERALVHRLPLDLSWLSEAYLLVGRRDQAKQSALNALEVARRYGEIGHEAWILWQLGEIHSTPVRGAGKNAEKFFRGAQTIAEERRMVPLIAHCHLGLSRLYVRRRAWDAAQREFTAAVSHYSGLDMGYWLHRARAEIDIGERTPTHA